MKLALITRRYPPDIGGAEKVLSYLAPALAAEGADVTVLTADAPGRAEREEIDVPAGRLTVIRLATSRARFVGTWLYMRNLGHWLSEHAIDAAYVSMLKHDAYVTVEQGRRHGFPVVLRPEGAGATGDIAWQSWGRFGQTIARRCREADAIVSISQAITHELLAAGFDGERIQALPNGVPVPTTPWQPRPDWQSAPRARFVGRLAPEKGLDTLVDAWPSVRATHPRATLTLIGEGPERAAIEGRIERLGLAGTVELAGASANPRGQLLESDLFILPSREEGMSIALLEAMALGIPLVASAIPGNQQLVQDQVHGRLAPPDDPAALARAILDQWAGFDRAARMGQAARRRVAKEFSIAAVARKHLDLFQRLVDRSGKGRSG
ncbi:Glycosyltransferase involved in cell wall bisynthesis [Singulisphaera sp. GP187]|uniref:glycosyltransferase family 4 protein n=1 Tax=Singulisphaera sp. GP187 TaxID=1882752 RepID=UPI00092B1D45|nr:glycosyltransferase family 4 protein [Singulisphaera sp. GP187]SIO40598.1 Glycosyltransferase involved in cell wall bisynthesis [Singulisphaera sp. GP187]